MHFEAVDRVRARVIIHSPLLMPKDRCMRHDGACNEKKKKKKTENHIPTEARVCQSVCVDCAYLSNVCVRISLLRRFRSAKHGVASLIPIPRANTRGGVSTVVCCLRIRSNQTQNHTGKYHTIYQSQIPAINCSARCVISKRQFHYVEKEDSWRHRNCMSS